MFRFSRLLPLGLAAAGMVLAGCNAEPLTQPGTTTTLVAVSGDQQTGAPGAVLQNDFSVRAVNAANAPQSGVTVTWTVTAGGGSLDHATSVTDANGLAAARLTLGAAAGTQNLVTASAPGADAITFTATATGTGGSGNPGPGGSTNLTFRAIDAGSYHTCAITLGEQAYCWGFNQEGQLGDSSLTSQLSPTAVRGGINFRQISGGRYHTCGESFSGVGYCWGSNVDGRLGTGAYETPVISPQANAKAVALYYTGAGLLHSCALTFGGTAVCWGYNGDGEVGYVTDDASSDTLGFVRTAERFRTITVGGMHACGLVQTASAGGFAAGTALCWGFNDRGQLGNGVATPFSMTFDTSSAAVTQLAGGVTVFDSISAGYKHTCALTSAGQAYCWGDNSYGQLGDGTTTNRTQPTPVAGGLTFVAISAGYWHTCGLTTSGAAYCWGRNTPNGQQESTGGQLGDGTTTNSSSPVAVSGAIAFSSISAGETTSCGISTTNAAYCWGDNEYGQLGTGNRTSSNVPVKVAGQP